LNPLDRSALGKATAYPDRYDPTLLFPVDREAQRRAIGLRGRVPFGGADLWTAYEISWLDARGKPQAAIGEFRVPCDSPALIESKSLKLYLGSFRNHGAFHEDCTLAIGKKIVEVAQPTWLRIGGYWYPRGGIPIDVFWQTGAPPEGLWLPDQGVEAYRGR
jgi:NADPH-dependent 7-cyano-7-deazaguanine reductase QueF-like protein